MDSRILVPGEADIPEFARGTRFAQRGVCALGIEDPVRILEAYDFVVLDQIDVIGLQAAQRFVELSLRLSLRPAVDLRHQEHLLPIAVAKRLPHSDLAGAAVVVPRVVHEVDAAIDCGSYDAKTELLVYGGHSEVPAAQPD